MIFRSLNIAIISRLLVFMLFSAMLGISVYLLNWIMMAPSVVLTIASAWEIVYYYNGINRKLTFFFDAIRNEDSTLHFPVQVRGKTLQHLHQSLNHLNTLISEIKIRNEYNERFFRELLKYSSTGLIAIDEQGYIDLVNDAALKLIGVKSLAHIHLLKQKNKALYDSLIQIKQGQTQTLKLLDGQELRQLSVKIAHIQFGEKKYKIFSIYDIRAELEENELDSWQKLIRVLTHEIMNSIAPITSLSNTLARLLKPDTNHKEIQNIPKQKIIKTLEGLSVIEEMGKGLMHFIDNYRKITKIPKPVFKPVIIKEWLDRLTLLMNNEFESENVKFQINNVIKKKDFIADEKLLTQVVINLIKNAIDATKNEKDKKIQLSILHNKTGRIQIAIKDNGVGITSTELEKIFVPFYTTKEKGSGIGLSLSRQIMRLHKGNIAANSIPGKGSSFVLTL